MSASAKSIPFNLKRGVPEVEVVINGKTKALFIIDTGADHVYIDKSFAEKHGLLSGGKMPMRPVTGVDDKVEAFQIFLRSLEIGDLKKNVVSAVTIDISSVVQDTSSGLPDGVLGYSFLRNQPFLLDYENNSLQFKFDYIDFKKTKIANVAFTLDRHFITVNTNVNDSINARMILDTGASHTLFSFGLEKLLNINDSVKTAKIQLDNRVTTSGVKFLARDISAVSSLIKSPKISGILGTTFLYERKILIDYEHNQLVFIAN